MNLEEAKKFLDGLDLNDYICIDTETISFDDKTPALYPYKGTRVSTILIGQNGKDVLALPIRHRTNTKDLYPFTETIQLIQEFVSKITKYVNANPKFDMRVLAQDGIRFSKECKVYDTQVWARYHYNQHTALNLDYLTMYYKTSTKKSDAAKNWIKANNTQDYGAIPIDILVPYGIDDVNATIALFRHLKSVIPEESLEQLEVEAEFTNLLFECEDNGLLIDKRGLLIKRIELLQKIINVNREIIKVTGLPKFNPNSHVQVGKFFSDAGVEPLKLTDEGGASWDKNVLALINSIDHGDAAAKLAELLLELGEYKIQESTFCAGWCEQADSHSYIHPDFRQAGTRTGRLSCGDPNAQNFPDWMQEYLLIPEGYVGVKWDLSQIEYRKFTHYSNNERLLKSYADNPEVDYHQIMADALGLPRKPVKTLNFGILYGMGVKKLKASIIKVISDNDSDALRQSLQKFVPEMGIPKFPERLSSALAAEIATGILRDYHAKLPEIKALNKQIKGILERRGYIKNFYGRRIYLTPDKAYIALNALIQGGCADYFKRILVKLHKSCRFAHIVDNIHDADMSVMLATEVQTYWNTLRDILSQAPYRVPILAECEIAIGRWSNHEKVGKDNDCNAAIQRLLLRGNTK